MKVSETKNGESSSTFVIEGEGLTLGNVLQSELQADEHVLFTGVSADEHNLTIKIETDAKVKPVEALEHAASQMEQKVDAIRASFIANVEKFRSEAKQSEVGGEAKQSEVGGEAKKSEVGGTAKKSEVGGEAKQSEVGGEAKQSEVGGAAKQSKQS